MEWQEKLDFIVSCGLYTKKDVAFIMQSSRPALYRWLRGVPPDEFHQEKIAELFRLANLRLEGKLN